MKSITAMELQESSSSYLGSRTANCNLLRVQLLSGSCRELTNPILGRDFLAGTLEDAQSLGIFKRSILRSVEFIFQPELGSESMQFSRKAIGELLTKQNFPTIAKLSYLEPDRPVQNVPLIGISRGFLFTEYYQNPAIPIASLGSIEMDCA